MDIQLTSTAFSDGAMIPKRFTCDGEDVSPPLSWSGLPAGTGSLALICDDPDAPVGTWDHWVLFNIPATATGLPEDVPAKATLDDGSVHGNNSWARLGYGGPCPPSGTHRYFFKLYALDIELNLTSGATTSQLVKAMEGHILDQGQLMGKYRR
ncbi:MAG: YbhB/YbcL family Raf kinase inhibitor-like protein [Desulfobacterales bacterium]